MRLVVRSEPLGSFVAPSFVGSGRSAALAGAVELPAAWIAAPLVGCLVEVAVPLAGALGLHSDSFVGVVAPPAARLVLLLASAPRS